MKKLNGAFLTVLLLLSFQAKVFAEEPKKVPTVFKRIFVPGGFDSNDQVQIVGQGLFNNSCYRPAETLVRVDAAMKRLYLTPMAFEYPGICLQVMLPFQKVVDLGILRAGTWEVFQGAEPTKVGQVQIHIAKTESSDDYLYAPVSQAFFFQEGSVSNFTITGEFANDCLQLEEVKVTVEPDVVVLQPIAKVVDNPDCKVGRFSFSKTISIDSVPAGRYLLHIRSLNGNAVNSLINVN